MRLRSPEETSASDDDCDAADASKSICGSNLDGPGCSPTTCEKLRSGSVVLLDGPIGEPAAIYAGGRLIGRGEIVVVDGKIGVRVVELLECRRQYRRFSATCQQAACGFATTQP